MDQLLEILEIARETESDPVTTATAYYRASEAFEIPWLRRRTFAAVGDDHWEVRAAQVLSDDLSRAHRKIVVGVLRRVGDDDNAASLFDYQSSAMARNVERFGDVIEELKAEETVGLAAISVATRELGILADRLGLRPGQEDRR